MSTIRRIDPQQLKLELAKPGRSQAGLARALGIDTSAVNRIVNGKRQIKADELETIARYLGATDKPTSASLELKITSKSLLDALSIMLDSKGQELVYIARKAINIIIPALYTILDEDLNGSAPHELYDINFWKVLSERPTALIGLAVGRKILSTDNGDKVLNLLNLSASDNEADTKNRTLVRRICGSSLPDNASETQLRFYLASTAAGLALSVAKMTPELQKETDLLIAALQGAIAPESQIA